MALVITLIIGALIYYALRLFSTAATQALRNSAVTSCLASASQEFTDPKTGLKSTYPLQNIYRICLTDKGYQSQWK